MRSSIVKSGCDSRKNSGPVRHMVMTNLDRDRMTPSDASRAATGWLIALQESPQDSALRADFESWRAAAPEHGRAWNETEQVAGLIASTPPGTRHAGFRRRAAFAAAA